MSSSGWWWWRRWRWRPVKVWPGCQWGWRWAGEEKGQPFGFVPFPLILALLQLQFSVEVQVKGYRSRVTPGKMSVSAQSSSDALIKVDNMLCSADFFVLSLLNPFPFVILWASCTDCYILLPSFVFQFDKYKTSDGRNVIFLLSGLIGVALFLFSIHRKYIFKFINALK